MAKSINCFYFSSFTVLANERKTARLLGLAVIIIVIIKTTVVKIVVCIIIFIKFLALFRSYNIFCFRFIPIKNFVLHYKADACIFRITLSVPKVAGTQ